MRKQQKVADANVLDANSNIDFTEPGVRRERLRWGFLYTGTRDALLESKIVALAWLPDGIERNEKGQIKRTRVTHRHNKEIKCVEEAHGIFKVWMPYSEDEEGGEVAKYQALDAKRRAQFNVRNKKDKLAAYKGANLIELKHTVSFGAAFMRMCVDHASGQMEKLDFGVVTARFPSDVIEKLNELAMAWDSTVKNAEVVRLDHKRAHLSVVR